MASTLFHTSLQEVGICRHLAIPYLWGQKTPKFFENQGMSDDIFEDKTHLEMLVVWCKNIWPCIQSFLQCWSLAGVDSWGLVTKSFADINSSDHLTESFAAIHPFTSYWGVLGLRTTDLDSWSWSFICKIIISGHRLKQASQEWCGQLCLYP